MESNVYGLEFRHTLSNQPNNQNIYSIKRPFFEENMVKLLMSISQTMPLVMTLVDGHDEGNIYLLVE